MASILVVDDEPAIQAFVRTLLEKQGHDVVTASNGEVALTRLEESPFDVVISDFVMKPMNGLELLKHVRAHYPNVQVILISGYCQVQDAVDLFKEGAFDYLPKPVKVDDLRETVCMALEYKNLLSEGRSNYFRRSYKYAAGGLLAENPEMVHVAEMAQRIAPTDMSVLISGEAGSGRDTVTRALHDLSSRKEGPYVTVVCSTRPEEKLSEVLFGEEGSGPKGAIAKAGGGTLYLKDVDEMPMAMQQALLSALSGNDVNVRLVASTGADLGHQTEVGTFDPKLFARLNLVRLMVPPLRDRVEEILPLAHIFLKEEAGDASIVPEIDHEAAVILENYDWPGNCFELREVMKDTWQRVTENRIHAELLSHELRSKVDVNRIMLAQRRELDQLRGRSLKTFLRDHQKHVMKQMSTKDDADSEAPEAPEAMPNEHSS